MTDTSPDFTETQVSTRIVYRGRLLELREDEVRLPDGKHTRREYVRHPGAVAMLPLLDARTVVLVRQFRYPVGRHFYEIPAGKVDAGEELIACARRELREECGYEAREWQRLTTLHPCIGYSDESIELFLARGLTHVGHALDEEEFLEAINVDLADALDWVREGKITDPKTMIGLLWADKYCGR